MPNSNEFAGRVAVVTGAGGGLGRAYARALAAHGAAVVVNDYGVSEHGERPTDGPAKAVADEIKAAGGRAAPSFHSVATEEGGRDIINTAIEHFGRVDIVISNAAIRRNSLFGEITQQDLDDMLAVHLKGAFNISQPAFEHMKKQRYGRLLMVASSTALFGSEINQICYAACKGALVSLAFGLANIGKEYNVLSNALMPNAMTERSKQGSPDLVARMAPTIAKFDNGFEPDFVAPLALYLCSEQSTATHGVYSALGGHYARANISLGAGWLGPRDEPASLEAVASHFAEIDSRSGGVELNSSAEEVAEVIRRVERQKAANR